jgi:hypothetical protein
MEKEMGEIMVAATENKRGRPKKINDSLYYAFPECEKRTAQNIFYVSEAIRITDDKPGGFFVTNKGMFRRNGIAEQIGRACVDGLISEEQGRELAEIAINQYANGKSVKEIEKDLRIFRQTLQRELSE